ncbi:DUF7694 domain-containing protein [Sphingomonas pituitosa]|uniref:DUF7694 domain-containing protein n=1 Tax=Sphingomonas pituitosa TaxID=99597 RepID=UPI000B2B844F|nr:hypothetical protein [Sphingomonas pituitosa]
MKPNAAQLRQLKRDNMRHPAALVAVPWQEWPSAGIDEARRLKVYRSREFLVQVYEEPGGILRLSVNRTTWCERSNSWRENISWDDLQRLKREAGYADRWAVEIYPADRAVVNVANMRHLWLLDQPPAYAWGASGE